jgi:hypothetical protein
MHLSPDTPRSTYAMSFALSGWDRRRADVYGELAPQASSPIKGHSQRGAAF